MNSHIIASNQIQGIIQLLESSEIRAHQLRDIRNLLISLPKSEPAKQPDKKESK